MWPRSRGATQQTYDTIYKIDHADEDILRLLAISMHWYNYPLG